MVLDKNTWNHMTGCKLFVLDKNMILSVGKQILKSTILTISVMNIENIFIIVIKLLEINDISAWHLLIRNCYAINLIKHKFCLFFFLSM